MISITKLFKILSGKKYRKCPSGAIINPAEIRGLNAGLINSEQIMAYCDSYATGLAGDDREKGLRSGWDVASPKEAAETLEWLSLYGHRFLYDIVFQGYIKGDSEGIDLEIFQTLVKSGRYGDIETNENDIQAAYETAMEMLENLRLIYRTLKDKVNGPYLPLDYSAGILAWDLGRLVTVARLSFDGGYIGQSELSRILVHVDKELSANFSSWPQFAKSYIIGRAAWGGQTITLDGIIGITEGLMTDKDSPWLLSPL
jgi:hypothetical protein